MKIRYERQIRKIAQQKLERDFRKQVKPYLGDLDSETRALIETEVANYPVRERYGDGTMENPGSPLHSIGKRIAEQLKPKTAPKPPSNQAGSPRWERFRPSASGRCALERAGDGAILSGDYERGTITTGKSEVFWGYYVSIRMETAEVVGKSQGDAGTYRYALDDCNRKLALEGLTLLAAGNAEGYSESALSGPAGFGYLKGHPGAVDILSRVDL